jgi:hypothetical protein
MSLALWITSLREIAARKTALFFAKVRSFDVPDSLITLATLEHLGKGISQGCQAIR